MSSIVSTLYGRYLWGSFDPSVQSLESAFSNCRKSAVVSEESYGQRLKSYMQYMLDQKQLRLPFLHDVIFQPPLPGPAQAIEKVYRESTRPILKERESRLQDCLPGSDKKVDLDKVYEVIKKALEYGENLLSCEQGKEGCASGSLESEAKEKALNWRSPHGLTILERIICLPGLFEAKRRIVELLISHGADPFSGSFFMLLSNGFNSEEKSKLMEAIICQLKKPKWKQKWPGWKEPWVGGMTLPLLGLYVLKENLDGALAWMDLGEGEEEIDVNAKLCLEDQSLFAISSDEEMHEFMKDGSLLHHATLLWLMASTSRERKNLKNATVYLIKSGADVSLKNKKKRNSYMNCQKFYNLKCKSTKNPKELQNLAINLGQIEDVLKPKVIGGV